MRKLYELQCNKRFLLLSLFALLLSATSVFADPYSENFANLYTLPEGWHVEGSASVYSVGDDRDYAGREGAAYHSLYTTDGASNTDAVVITPRFSGQVAFYARPYSTKMASGSVIVYEYTKENDVYVRGSELTRKTWSNVTSAWERVTVDCGSGKYLGIVLSKACLDNFVAENLIEEGSSVPGGNPEPQPVHVDTVRALKIVDFSRAEGFSYQLVADEKNEVTVKLVATVQNTGNIALGADEIAICLTDAAGKELGRAFAVDSLCADSLVTIPLEATFSVGEATELQVYMKELLTNTYCVSSFGYSKYVYFSVTPYLPAFTIKGADGYKLSADETIVFGYSNVTVQKSITIVNDGAAPLTVSSIDMPDGFTASEATFTVEAGSQKVVSLTLSTGTDGFGAKGGAVTITHTLGTFTFNVSGTTVNPTKYFVGFDDTQAIPESWKPEAGWAITSQSGNYYVQQTSYSDTTALVTQKLSVAEGDSLTFQAKRAYSYNAAYLTVSYSETGREGTWTEALLCEDITSAFQTYTVKGIPAGDYFLRFQGRYVAVDNVAGFTVADNMPALGFYDDYGKSVPANTEVDLGTMLRDSTVCFTIKNTGTGILSATLMTTGQATVTPASVDLHAGETCGVKVVMPLKPFGAKADTLVITGDDFDTLTVVLSGLSRDPEMLFVDFQDHQLPRGWQAEGKWSIFREDYGSDNYWAEHIDYNNTVSALTTCKVQVREGDVLAFDAKKYESYEPTLRLSYSADRQTWQTVADMTAQLSETMQTLTVDALPAGDCYLRFEGANVMIDNITGIHTAQADAHQLVITGFAVPDSCEVNNAAKFSVTVKNLWADSEEVSATLYLDGEAQGEPALKAVALNAEQTFTFNYVPRAVADSVPVRIVLTYAGGELTTDTRMMKVQAERDTTYAHTVSGRIVDSNDQPLENVSLLLVSKTGDAQYTGTTSADGTFSVKVVQGIYIYQLTASKAGYQDTTAVVAFGGEDVSDLTLTMLRDGETFVADTLALCAYDMPDSVTIGQPYVATIQLYSRKALTADAYRAVMFVDGETVAAETVGIAERDTVQLTFSYVPTALGTLRVSLMAELLNGGMRVTTPVKDVTVLRVNPVTAVTSLVTAARKGDAYDLNGRRAAVQTKGRVYVVNGKKLVRR